MSSNTVWITGAGGLIGNYLVQTAPPTAPGLKPVALTREKLELTDFAAVERAFNQQSPGGIIHCAALSRSPECQANPLSARQVNVDVTRHLAQLASAVPFVFFSTDLVFDGKQGDYDESAPVNPLSIYAETKAAAEQLVLRNPLHTVIRTSLNSGTSFTGDRGFDEQMRNAWRRGETLGLFTDEFRSPIGAEITARAVWELFQRRATGLFHVAGSERLSRWQIGQLLKDCAPGVQARMSPISIAEWKGAPRAPDTSLNSAKAQALLSLRLPAWSTWIKGHF
jgi:dTDP-4-dehydrorhamnose reductase